MEDRWLILDPLPITLYQGLRVLGFSYNTTSSGSERRAAYCGYLEGPEPPKYVLPLCSDNNSTCDLPTWIEHESRKINIDLLLSPCDKDLRGHMRHSSNTIPSGTRMRAANAVIWMGLSPPSMSYHPCPCHNSTPWPAYVKEHKSWKGDRKSYSQLPPYAKWDTRDVVPCSIVYLTTSLWGFRTKWISTGS